MGKIAVIGLGLTGKSAIDYLHARGEQVIALDTRVKPVGLDGLQQRYPGMAIHLGGLQSLLEEPIDRIVISPGVSLGEPSLVEARKKGISIVSDIDLFLEHNTAPVIAITGSNGKTTVTTWVGECLQALDYRVQVCGNIGTPVLENKLNDADFVVMELSSFQLDASHAINAEVAVCLNISPDHLDRHGSLENYIAAKMRVYTGAKKAIVNTGKNAGYSYQTVPGQVVSSFTDNDALPGLDLSEKSVQFIANAAAVVRILVAAGIDQAEAVKAVVQCKGLPHRFQTVATIHGVRYINDSKATNVGAAITAMHAAEKQSNSVILIAGGQIKAAPLDEWATVVKQKASAVMLYGEDALLMQAALEKAGMDAALVADLKTAVQQAYSMAKNGDCVLLAPAAASFDMFSSYEQRGDAFIQIVDALMPC